MKYLPGDVAFGKTKAMVEARKGYAPNTARLIAPRLRLGPPYKSC